MRKNGFSTGVMYIILVFLVVGLGIMIFMNFQLNRDKDKEREEAALAAATTPTPVPTETPEPTPTPARTVETVTLAFAGDIVAQPGLTTDAAGKTETNDDGSVTVSYDFYDEIAGVLPSLSGADLAACTLSLIHI